jgi:hypothetical protein
MEVEAGVMRLEMKENEVVALNMRLTQMIAKE